MSDADVALCVLALPEVVRALDRGDHETLENLASIAPANKTIALLNKTDLLDTTELSQCAGVAKRLKEVLGADKAWLVSMNTHDGVSTFLRELGDMLMKRSESPMSQHGSQSTHAVLSKI